MRIAILSDIHANAVALKAVLEEARTLKVECLFILGDLVGYYYQPKQVLLMLENWMKKVIQGNHERMLVEAENDQKRAEHIRECYGSGLDVAMTQLSQEDKSWLALLPRSEIVKMDLINCLLCHGSSYDPDAYLYPNTKSYLLERTIQQGVDFVFIGHTHHPFIFQHQGIMLVNVGSVGQSRVRGGIAQWAVLDTSNRSIVPRQTPFATETIIKEARDRDPKLPYLWQVLQR
ncbi:MAG: metallophosphatase family protein [Actinobacteria bacterium]|nr:metallophosphatase family protein [Actinomycetota bacterium]